MVQHDFWLIAFDMFMSAKNNKWYFQHNVISLWWMCHPRIHKERKFNSFYKYLPKEWVGFYYLVLMYEKQLNSWFCGTPIDTGVSFAFNHLLLSIA